MLHAISASEGKTPSHARQAYLGWLEDIETSFEPKEQYLIPILQSVQEKASYLPPEAMQAVARHLRIPESKVYGVASFYAQFHFEPRGKHTITICRGTACHVRGASRLVEEMETHLGIKAGGTTEDLFYTLESVACVGACALAPLVVIDEKAHGRQTPTSLKKTVNKMRGGPPKTKEQKKQTATEEVAQVDVKPTGSAEEKTTKKKAVKKTTKKKAAKKTTKKKAAKKTTKKKAAKKTTKKKAAKKTTKKKAAKKTTKKKAAKKTTKKKAAKKDDQEEGSQEDDQEGSQENDQEEGSQEDDQKGSQENDQEEGSQEDDQKGSQEDDQEEGSQEDDQKSRKKSHQEDNP